MSISAPARCGERFEAAPQDFLGDRPAAAAAPAGTQYTCPMHPEIVRDGPGSCPICGMALEPMGVPTGEEGPNPELVDFTRRLWVSAVLSLPLLLIAMGPMVGLPVREWLGEGLAAWLELALASPGGALGGAAVLPARLRFPRQPKPQHVDAHLGRRGRRLCLQRRGDAAARPLPPWHGRPWRRRTGLFRGGRGHRGAGVRRPGAGAQGARAHRLGHPGACSTCRRRRRAG